MTDLIDLDISNLPKPWTLKQAKFALALLADPKRQANKAAVAAGFSEKTADQQSSRMLCDVKFSHIQEYIKAREQKVVEKYAYDHDTHIRETVKQATYNIFDFYEPDPDTGELKLDWRKVPRELGTIIDQVETSQLSIKTVEGGEEISLPVLNTKVKFSSRTAAKDMLNKIMKNYQSVGDSEDNPMFVKFMNDIPRD